jgi:uncharacterized membrane protein YbhN (UPF0104 family)
MSSRWRSAARLVAAPLLLGAVIWVAGPRAMADALRQADAGWLLAGLASSIVSNIASAWRWAALARWLGHPVAFGWALAVYFRAVAVNALLPGAVVGGDMFRAWALRQRGCPMAEAGSSVVLDRLSGLWILYALGAIGLFVGASDARLQTLRALLHLPAAWPAQPMALALLALVLLLPLALLAAWRASGVGAPRLAMLRHDGALAQYALQALSSFVVQVFSVGAFACAARAFGVDLPAWLIAVTAVPIFLMAALPVSFGGWGTREAATAASWAAFGVAAPLAVGVSIAYGVYALVQAFGGLLLKARDPALAGPQASIPRES